MSSVAGNYNIYEQCDVVEVVISKEKYVQTIEVQDSVSNNWKDLKQKK